jgi:hypothetical protein
MASYDEIYNQINSWTRMDIGLSKPVGAQRKDMGAPVESSHFTDEGYISHQVGLTFSVGGRGLKMIVSLEPNDTYTVRLIRNSSRHGIWTSNLLDQCDMVTVDALNRVLRTMYSKFAPN